MKLLFVAFLTIPIAVIISGLNIFSLSADTATFESSPVEIAGITYNLEIADTPQKRQQGLMYRENLATRTGMIFIYSSPANNRIWMKNTLIPLTVIWLNDKARIIDIKELLPCRQRECPVYGVDEPSKYIIELNAGYDGLKPGDDIPAVLSLSNSSS